MTLTYISRSSDFYTFYVDVPLSLGCIIQKVSAEDIAIRGNGTGLEYMCPTRHFVYIFFNPVFQLSTAKNEINLFNNHVLIVAPVWGWSGGAKVLCILYHWGVQLILAYSWARPAILVVGKGRGGMFLVLLFLHFHSCSSFFSVPLFHLLYSLFYLFSPFLWETTQNDPQGLTCR